MENELIFLGVNSDDVNKSRNRSNFSARMRLLE